MKWYIGAALLLVVALFLQSGLLAYSMYVLLGIMLLSRLLARSWIENLSAVRTCKTLSAEIGVHLPVEVTIKNSGWLPVPWVLLEDLLPREALAQRPPRLQVVKGKRMQIRMLGAGGETTLRYRLEFHMRGYYQIGPLVAESGDLFGLHRRYRVSAEPHYVLIYPKVVQLLGYDVASRRPIGEVRLSHRLYEDPTRIAGVRPYQSGDPLNRVHWGATARTGTLHSKVYEPSTLAGATLLLDFQRAGYSKQGEPFRSELAITAAASLAHAIYQMGQQIGLITNAQDTSERLRLQGWEGDFRSRLAARKNAGMLDKSERIRPLVVETRRGAEQFQRIREMLARSELVEGSSFAQLVTETASRLPRDATVLAILPDVSIETAIALGTLRRQGFAITVVLILMDSRPLERGYGRLVSEGIRDIRHLRNEESLPSLCQQHLLGPIDGGWTPFADVPADPKESGPNWAERSAYEWMSSED